MRSTLFCTIQLRVLYKVDENTYPPQKGRKGLLVSTRRRSDEQARNTDVGVYVPSWLYLKPYFKQLCALREWMVFVRSKTPTASRGRRQCPLTFHPQLFPRSRRRYFRIFISIDDPVPTTISMLVLLSFFKDVITRIFDGEGFMEGECGDEEESGPPELSLTG
ncbi:hypothetical protein EVAR_4388_1 [Eumeta japonica]|uniref:Uncharacterized protein n=1 Tax=Eumeta variegata TaxID=151549 RepID=A0A4C1SYB0_EUMVA|nr:hypothetical protein EVAR_4388_1 [Eumeta japonica]